MNPLFWRIRYYSNSIRVPILLLPFFPNLLIMVPLRFSHHWAFWNGLFRGLPGLWAFFTPSFLEDIMGYVIFVGPLGGSANSDVVGFGGGLEGRPEIFAMDRNAEQAAPSTSTGLHIGAQQPPAHASTSTPVNQDELWDWDFLNEQPGMGRAGYPGAGPSEPSSPDQPADNEDLSPIENRLKDRLWIKNRGEPVFKEVL